jgi:hypothetical protein
MRISGDRPKPPIPAFKPGNLHNSGESGRATRREKRRPVVRDPPAPLADRG